MTTIIIKDETREIEYDGKKMTVKVNGKATAFLHGDGSWEKPFNGPIRASSIPAEIINLTNQATAIVKAAFTSKKAEMFPNFASLQYHEKQIAKCDILEALGHMSSKDADAERGAVKASYGVVMSQIEREKFDNQ